VAILWLWRQRCGAHLLIFLAQRFSITVATIAASRTCSSFICAPPKFRPQHRRTFRQVILRRACRRSLPEFGSPSGGSGSTSVAAEMIAVNSGLGYLISMRQRRQTLRPRLRGMVHDRTDRNSSSIYLCGSMKNFDEFVGFTSAGQMKEAVISIRMCRCVFPGNAPVKRSLFWKTLMLTFRGEFVLPSSDRAVAENQLCSHRRRIFEAPSGK